MRDIRVIGLEWWQYRTQEYGFIGYFVKITDDDGTVEMTGPFDTPDQAYGELAKKAEEEGECF